MIEAREGRTVREIWLADGEPAYRVMETEVLREALAAPEPSVVAAAGGVVLREENRRLLEAADVFTVRLSAPPEVLAERVSRQVHRPLLDDDPLGTLRRLAEEREALYKEVADATIDVGEGRAGRAGGRCAPIGRFAEAGVTDLLRVEVPLAGRAYDVWVGPGAAGQLAEVLPPRARRVALVTQAGVPDLVHPEVEVVRCEIGDGEQHKTLTTVEALCRAFVHGGLTRTDCVVAVGGGIVTDVAGFAAASYHRGIGLVNVPTTLLGMVDAAIGGKTGVNLPEGKNLVGAFWQPAGVLCDLDALDTLPERELACGYGEMAKYHFLTGDDLLALPLAARVARCVAIKAEVVAARRARVARDHRRPRAGSPELRPHARARPGDRRWPRPTPR